MQGARNYLSGGLDDFFCTTPSAITAADAVQHIPQQQRIG